jgi:sulfatase maturation enzyme AslB (radical SAM superfamily)
MPNDEKMNFKANETESSILVQLSRNKIFGPLKSFLHEEDIKLLNKVALSALVKKITIAELKTLLSYSELDKDLIPQQELSLLISLLKGNSNIILPLPYIVRLNKKILKKLMRINKYYYNGSYLFQKFSSEKILKKEEFFLPFLQESVLLALCEALPEWQNVSVGILNDLNPLLNIKAMLAIKQKVKENPDIQPKAATLIMSEDCNLRCIYCYEPHQKRDKTVLTFETAKQVLRKFDRDCRVTFFGGEPMLHVDLMKQICEWGWEYRNFSFEMVTNGQVIDREFFRDYAKYFSYVQLSCDGPETVQEINRGHGSFRRAMNFYKVFKEETGFYPTLHTVLSKYSIPYLFDSVKWFYKMELSDQNNKVSLRWLPGDANTWVEEDFALYAEQLVLIKDWYLKNNIRKTIFSIRAFAQAEKDLLGIENPEKTPLRDCDAFCSAGRTLMAVLPSGIMVPCHHEYWCGKEDRVYEELAINEDSPGLNHMSELSLKDIPECNSCPQWGCCVCPGSFFFHSKSYTTPDKNWCRAGKMLIETAKSYVEDLTEQKQTEQNSINYLAAGVDYLLQKENPVK